MACFWCISLSRNAALYHHFKAPLRIYDAQRKKKGFQKDWHGESVVPFLLSIVQCAQPVKTARTFILVLSRAQEDFYTSNLTSSDSDGLCVGKDHIIPSAFASPNCGFKQFCRWHVMKTLQKPWEGVVPFSFKFLSARDAGRSVA